MYNTCYKNYKYFVSTISSSKTYYYNEFQNIDTVRSVVSKSYLLKYLSQNKHYLTGKCNQLRCEIKVQEDAMSRREGATEESNPDHY